MTRLTDTRTAQPRPALVLLKGGYTYEARVEIEAGRLVHGQDVRLRVADGSYRRLGDRSWSVSQLRELRYREDDRELAF